MSLAIPQAVVHHEALCAFSDALRQENPRCLEEWEEQVRAWEDDHNKFCPYDLPEESTLPLRSHTSTHSVGQR